MIGHLEGAKAGIMMKANPQLGTPAYSQGYAPPPFFWDDLAKPFKMEERTCVPAGCFEDLLVIDEFELAQRNAFQEEYYARGVSVVRVGWRGKGEKEREVLRLIEAVQLGPKQLEEVRQEVLEHERRAYVYASTPAVQ